VVVEGVVVSNEPNCPQSNSSKLIKNWFGELEWENFAQNPLEKTVCPKFPKRFNNMDCF